MKRLIVFLFILLIAGGIKAVYDGLNIVAEVTGFGIWALVKSLPHIPTSFFDVIANNLKNNWSLTQLLWLDTFLFNIATIVPSIITFIISKQGFHLSTTTSSVISIVVLVGVLELFGSLIFWVILGILFFALLVFICIFNKRENQTKECKHGTKDKENMY